MKDPMKSAVAALSKLTLSQMGRAWGIAAARRIRDCEKLNTLKTRIKRKGVNS